MTLGCCENGVKKPCSQGSFRIYGINLYIKAVAETTRRLCRFAVHFGISLLTKFALNFVSSVLIWLHGVLSPEINTSKEVSYEKAKTYYCSADPCGHCAVRLLSGNALAARSEHNKKRIRHRPQKRKHNRLKACIHLR